MLLSNSAILRHLERGSIVIEPFDAAALNNVSYDLTLGAEIARYRVEEREAFNPAANDPADMFRIEGASGGGFWLRAGERVLAHSREIAGGRQVKCERCGGTGRLVYPSVHDCHDCNGKGAIAVTTHLQATSTAARVGISVCQCAGWGDVGYLSNWTFEIQNHSPRGLFLPVGAVLAQVCFHEVEPILDGTSYEKAGSYQKLADPAEIAKAWRASNMLPKRIKVRP